VPEQVADGVQQTHLADLAMGVPIVVAAIMVERVVMQTTNMAVDMLDGVEAEQVTQVGTQIETNQMVTVKVIALVVMRVLVD
jgi:hypothetical protein